MRWVPDTRSVLFPFLSTQHTESFQSMQDFRIVGIVAASLDAEWGQVRGEWVGWLDLLSNVSLFRYEANDHFG